MTLPFPDRDVKDDVIEKMCAAFDEKDHNNEVGDEPFWQWPENWKEPLRKQMRAAVRALANNDAAYELLARQIAINEGDDPDTMTGWAAKYPIWHEHTSAVQAVLTALRAIAGPET